MSSFFVKLRGAASATTPSLGSSPSKKDGSNSQQTPLEKLLADIGPLRQDGSDRFFGMENFGSSCYCNSILQSLYYSAPFREQVLQYPRRSPMESIKEAQKDAEEERRKAQQPPPTSPLQNKPKTPLMSPTAAAMGRKVPQTQPTPGQTRPEDIKDSPEWKKKNALLAGPILQMDYENNLSYDMPDSLYTGLKDIFEAVAAHNSRTGIVSPLKFIEILKRGYEQFRNTMHQDAHEFLNLLLNAVVGEVEAHLNGKSTKNGEEHSIMSSIDPPDSITSGVPPKTLPWLHDLFEGTLTSETRCLTCETTSQRDEIFLDLSVDLEEHSSVTSCLRKFSEEEMLCERNKFHCDNCGGLQEAEKRMKIKRLPRILALHLKRFKYTEDLQRLQKLFHRVVYPYHLRLFNTTDDAEHPDRFYELYAVVVHIGGGPYHGHYVSIIKTEDRGWLLFDDELVEPVDKSYVRNFFGDRPGMACAYLLFYQETTYEAMEKEREMEERGQTSDNTKSSPKDLAADLKPNGTLANGSIHPVQTISHPYDSLDPFVALDHTKSAPAQISSLAAEIPKPGLTGEADATLTKKERAKAEKELKLAEKQRLKDQEAQRKEAEKLQKEQAKAAQAAQRSIKSDDDTRNVSFGEQNRKENGSSATGVMHNSLSRFKQGSKSINKRMFGLKGSDDSSGNIPPADALTRAFIPPSVIEETKADNTIHAIDKAEKPKSHRFSLKKKTSTNLL